ncbi:N-acyl-D-amino-acid deacylase family protein [Kordiimonas aestuarii]|uniref:N-acyl-D-amino-acid deacylase family protein n=1 Tax=Kordiimonas aestuarii TaxID=1005925 RepID=UPI0021D0CDFB|nr:amidohydrolase family protein [Kordiimonas aestuarii]
MTIGYSAFYRTVAFFWAALTLFSINAKADEQYDYLIKGGVVYDGSGSAGEVRDIVVSGGVIAFWDEQNPGPIQASRIIDASGFVVAPGFIDPHTHSLDDLENSKTRQNLNYLTQGVTTVFTGNDGGGSPNVRQVKDGLAEDGVGTNVALYVGHGAVRRAVMGTDKRPPEPFEMQAMKDLVRQAMADGAFGLSSGLYYAPGSFATTDEVATLAEVTAGYCGVYDSHMRDESSYTIGLLDAVREAIEIGRRAGVPTHISHIKALGVDVHGKSLEVIGLVNAARAEGLDVTADQYPWLASGTSIAASLVPRWAMAGGRDAMKERLQDTRLKQRLAKEMAENLRRRGGPDSLLVVGGEASWQGKTLADLAGKWRLTPIDAAVRIVLAGDADVASFNMHEEDVINFMRQPWVMTGSDGSGGHPRKYATYPQKFQQYVIDAPVLSLSDFIRKGSGLVADSLGLKGRGYLKPGFSADIVIFDPETYRANATYRAPEKLSSGVEYLMINGELAIDKGHATGKLSGQVLTHTTDCTN